jgi:isocitrate dehydrogenase (NAD+)
LDKAARLRRAIDDTLNVDGIRTGDLHGTANCKSYTQALIARIRNS